MFPLNADDHRYMFDHLSHVPIPEITFIGMVGITGLFMGQSISTSTSVFLSQTTALTPSPMRLPIGLSKSLLTPSSLVPLSWEFDLTLVSREGELSEETLLVILVGMHLGVKLAGSPSRVSAP